MTETGSENLKEKYINNDKDDLIKQNKELKEQIETELDKLNKKVKKNKKTNNALKVLLQELQDENSYYKN
ncbi:5553_t:CDS:2, partial [Scutellospora calospora]